MLEFYFWSRRKKIKLKWKFCKGYYWSKFYLFHEHHLYLKSGKNIHLYIIIPTVAHPLTKGYIWSFPPWIMQEAWNISNTENKICKRILQQCRAHIHKQNSMFYSLYKPGYISLHIALCCLQASCVTGSQWSLSCNVFLRWLCSHTAIVSPHLGAVNSCFLMRGEQNKEILSHQTHTHTIGTYHHYAIIPLCWLLPIYCRLPLDVQKSSSSCSISVCTLTSKALVLRIFKIFYLPQVP